MMIILVGWWWGKVKLWCKGPVINTFTVLYYVVAILLKREFAYMISILDSYCYDDGR